MRADIHDGQEHKRSIHGPDTEAQDQSSPSITFGLQQALAPPDVRYASISDQSFAAPRLVATGQQATSGERFVDANCLIGVPNV